MHQALAVIGLGWGDECKGSEVDHQVTEQGYDLVVRYGGGSQAAHRVVMPDGRHYAFAQLGAGSFHPNVQTILSRFMIVSLEELLKENREFVLAGGENRLPKTLISENCPVITAMNLLINQIKELSRGDHRHGSVGAGFGETVADVQQHGNGALYVHDLLSPRLNEKLKRIWERRWHDADAANTPFSNAVMDIYEALDMEVYAKNLRDFARQVRIVTDVEIATLIASHDTVFEGAQGVLLGERHGFFPHCTHWDVSLKNVYTLLAEAGFQGKLKRCGVLRAYATRHGAGPLVTEDKGLVLPDVKNSSKHPWQQDFRVGWQDAMMTRYALQAIGGVDHLVVTCLDRLAGLPEVKVATHYDDADPRFFNGSIKLLNGDLSLMAERTETMRNIQPRYEFLPGWQDPHSPVAQQFLDEIGRLVGKHVDAYSVSPVSERFFRK